MKIERREARRTIIFVKFERYLRYKAGEKGSPERATESLNKIGIAPNPKVLKAYLYGIFAAICFEVTALSDIRGIPRAEINEFWKDFEENKGSLLRNWISSALRNG